MGGGGARREGRPPLASSGARRAVEQDGGLFLVGGIGHGDATGGEMGERKRSDNFFFSEGEATTGVRRSGGPEIKPPVPAQKTDGVLVFPIREVFGAPSL